MKRIKVQAVKVVLTMPHVSGVFARLVFSYVYLHERFMTVVGVKGDFFGYSDLHFEDFPP